ncbi:protein Asterix-like [Tropilaelaps mercedesae]|uniref:Protein Asterix-like n=1 Tax=Tropilaelaps mercedesae TaxID=418985 RepID=A0A1V9X6Z8_9ACAR|nr:protein Asterix-like [Tropilaelaps mercedesae]
MSGSQIRHDKIIRYKVPPLGAPGADDATSDYMNVLGIIFSVMGLMMKMKWCSWLALLCSSVTFANSRVNEDSKQLFSSFILSVSAVVMTYLQNPQPMTLPWSF